MKTILAEVQSNIDEPNYDSNVLMSNDTCQNGLHGVPLLQCTIGADITTIMIIIIIKVKESNENGSRFFLKKILGHGLGPAYLQIFIQRTIKTYSHIYNKTQENKNIVYDYESLAYIITFLAENVLLTRCKQV